MNDKKKRAPIPIPPWEDADCYAIQCLEKGIATPDQQKRALRWIIYNACATYDFCDQPETERLAAIFDGRRFAGLQIIKLISLDLAKIKQAKEKAQQFIKSSKERR